MNEQNNPTFSSTEGGGHTEQDEQSIQELVALVSEVSGQLDEALQLMRPMSAGAAAAGESGAEFLGHAPLVLLVPGETEDDETAAIVLPNGAYLSESADGSIDMEKMDEIFKKLGKSLRKVNWGKVIKVAGSALQGGLSGAAGGPLGIITGAAMGGLGALTRKTPRSTMPPQRSSMKPRRPAQQQRWSAPPPPPQQQQQRWSAQQQQQQQRWSVQQQQQRQQQQQQRWSAAPAGAGADPSMSQATLAQLAQMLAPFLAQESMFYPGAAQAYPGYEAGDQSGYPDESGHAGYQSETGPHEEVDVSERDCGCVPGESHLAAHTHGESITHETHATAAVGPEEHGDAYDQEDEILGFAVELQRMQETLGA